MAARIVKTISLRGGGSLGGTFDESRAKLLVSLFAGAANALDKLSAGVSVERISSEFRNSLNVRELIGCS